MAVSTIDRVREAELKANEARDEAELKAREIVSNAEAEADRIVAQAKAQAVDLDKRACDEAKQRADVIVRERREQAQAEAQALTEKTLKLKQNVINKLIRETLV